MNRKFVAIISVAAVLLVALIIALSIFRSNVQISSAPDLLVAPTSTPFNRGFRNVNNNNQVVLPTLDPEEQKTLLMVKKFLPYDSDALAVDYSTLTNMIYIEKKNEKADEELKKFLEINNLVEAYNKNPELFKIISANINEKIGEEEQSLTESDTSADEPTLSPTPTPNPNDPSDQVKPMMNVFKSLMGFNSTLLPYPTTTRAPVPSTLNNQTTTTNQTTQQTTPIARNVSGAQIGSYKMRVKWDFQNLELTCEPKPGTLAIVSYLKKQFGSSASYGISGGCKTYTGKVYAHLAGLGVDYFFLAKDPAALKRGNEVFAWLVTNAQNIGIQYVKYWRVHWTPGGGIHCVDNTISPGDQYAHSNHIHFELNLAGANRQTPFFTRGASLPAAMIINQEICPLLDPRMRS